MLEILTNNVAISDKEKYNTFAGKGGNHEN
jgi:hypothetical protein